jgi:hypothetical protein
VVRGEALGGGDDAVLVIDQHGVGVSAAGVDAEA